MFRRYRVSDYKSYLNSVRKAKNLNELNTAVAKEFNEVCCMVNNIRNSFTGKAKIKDLSILKNKIVTENSKIIGSLQSFIEDKQVQIKKKYLKPRKIRKEAEKLCQNLMQRSFYEKTAKWTVAGSAVSQTAGLSADGHYQPIFWEAVANSNKKTINPQVLETEFDTTPEVDFVSDNNNETGLETKFESTPEVDFAPVSNNETDATSTTEAIPEPPPVPAETPVEGIQETLNQINALGEPTFASLGLGGWTPVGMVQNCMEYVHVTLGVEWWAAIMIGTLVIRLLMFPLVILTQRNAAKMNNYMPQMQVLQMKMTEARQTGNVIEAARYSQEMMLFMKEKGLNPLKNLIVPIAQAPVFISFFVGLRQMANVPVESLTTGGMLWFTDLTLPDQYMALPIITSITLWATIEVGTDAARLSSQNLQTMKYVLRALPLVILPFTINFPGAILCYWVSSNFISLGQVAVLKIPKVREYFKIEPLITHKPEDMPLKKKGFTEGIKDSWTNIKITKELEDRRQIDALQFRSAGKGPIVKTYKYDPTRVKNAAPNNAVNAKKRD